MCLIWKILISLLMMMSSSLWIIGWLRMSRDYRFSDGYDRDLENDYQAMLDYFKGTKEKSEVER